jgi:hypothetical protein
MHGAMALRGIRCLLALVICAAMPGLAPAMTADEDAPAPRDQHPDDATAAQMVPRFSVHGFADIDAYGARYSGDQSGSHSSFKLGELDLLLAAEFGPRARFLSEVVFEPEDTNENQVDVERLLFRYEFADAGWVIAGRDHTPLGWWNSAYHHGLLLSPTIERPRVIAYEDHGGILPMHLVGAQGAGRVRGRSWGFEGIGGVANGRGPVPTEVQVFDDANDQKAVVVRAEAIRIHGLTELRLGVSGYWDTIPPDPTIPGRESEIAEAIGGLHAVFESPRVQIVSEYYRLRHRPGDTDIDEDSSGGFGLFVWKAWAWKPYAEYETLDVDPDDLYFAGYPEEYRRAVLGVRFDPHPFVAIKIEARREHQDSERATGIAAQLALGF